MVFYGGEPRLGTLEEQELGRGGRGEGGGGGEGWEGLPTRDNSSVCLRRNEVGVFEATGCGLRRFTPLAEIKTRSRRGTLSGGLLAST